MATTADDVWQLLAELTTKQSELTAAQKETDLQLKENAQQQKETDRQIKQINGEIRQLSKEIGNLGGKWGRFVENMVAPACETIFLKRGIPVHQVSQRVKKRLNGQTLEIDVLVANENHILVVEVKSSLGVNDVKELIEDLGNFRQFFPEYNQKQLYGAVAGIEIEEGADKYAYRQGLFVLAQAGETVSISNNLDFQPKNW
ncbi:DUF3782 domain-containing protein [Aphanothece sacrum]|uniref:DUF3782 domain-containing protein n=1 Tax=Aphanothece sacrum FPU1 TaxID=1920663 RepID=A0A401IG65_APHSA|nr:DUF3782 domain-containing protein [Aphanothece sacrum]GBF80201.1 hypothetical protein AsFPU1_1602 [Aphanothece sacrum FPU1]GBF85354.1 hypothetical protein AsFPU3_2413 [Aphanothece sacrum FPU3]